MPMRMTIDSYNKMNELVRKCFDANAVIDNLAYNLDFYYYNQIAEIVHKHVAHVMPQWADLVSDKMLELSAKPLRRDISGYEEDYKELGKIFEVLGTTLLGIREYVKGLIESADMNGDDEVRIFGENFLDILSPYIKQADEWLNASMRLSAEDLNIHIKQFTHFIEA